MNCDVTLKAEEFKTLHNSLYYLDCLDNPKVSELVETIRGALKGAYEQERSDFDRKSDHYASVRENLGLDAIWSMYEIENLNERHPFAGDVFVVYKDHWGEKPVHCAVYGSTWAAIYMAANACIRQSGDEHHVFIEGFVQDGNNLVLTTGS